MDKPVLYSIDRIQRELTYAVRPKDERTRPRSTKAALSELDQIDRAHWPFAALWLHSWIVDLLSSRRIKVKSARSYASAVVAPFLCDAHGLDLHSMTGDEFHEFYECMLEKRRVVGKRYWKAERLDQLHRYGVEKLSVEPLPVSLTKGNTATLVSARIVPEVVFQTFRDQLVQYLGQDHQHREALWVYCTMVYRGALRRCELLKLLCRDIDFGDTVWLHIRANQFGTNKSRLFKVPISSLLLPRERERVRVFLSAHRPSSANRLSPIFHESGLFSDVWDADLITRESSKILNNLAPDCALSLHAFRHTALSRIALVLCGTTDRATQFTPYSSEQCEEIEHVIGKSTVYGKDDSWCMAAMVGHGAPDVTYRNYIHTLDLCLHDQLQANASSWNRNQVRNLSGTTHRTVNQWLPDYDLPTAPSILHELNEPTLDALMPFATVIDRGANAQRSSVLPTSLAAPDLNFISIDRTIYLLNEVIKGDKDAAQLADDCGVPLALLSRWMDNVEIINSLTTQRPSGEPGNQGKTRPTLRHVSSLRQDSESPGLFPRRPKFQQDHQDIPLLIAAIEQAYESDRDAVKALCGQWLNRRSTSASYLPIDSIEQLRTILPILTGHIPASRWRLRVLLAPDNHDILDDWQLDDGMRIEVDPTQTRNLAMFPDGRARLYLRSRVEAALVRSKNIHNRFNSRHEVRSAGKYSSGLLHHVLFFAAVTFFDTWELRELVGVPIPAGEQRSLGV